MCETRLVLEVPVERTKHTSQWPKWATRLLVYYDRAHDDDALWSKCAQCIKELAHIAQHVYAHPLSCLLPDSRTEEYFQDCGLASDAHHLEEYYWVVHCRQVEGIVALMKQASFEGVVFFCVPDLQQAKDVVQKAAIEAPLEDGRYDTPFFQHCGEAGGFIFFSHTHDNLEILGTQEFVVKQCFERILGDSPLRHVKQQ